MFFIFIIKINCDGAEGATEFDHLDQPLLTDKNGKDMSKDSVIGIKKPESIIVDPITDCRRGARKLSAQATKI
jgi:hypothetical protein